MKQALGGVFVAMLVVFGGCKRTTCQPAPDGHVLACVEGDAVTVAEVQGYVRMPEWVPGRATLPDPRRTALDEAIRAHLFAAEARRRMLPVPPGSLADSVAVRAQALIADELARHGISRDAVPEAEAKRYYDEHPEGFGQIDEFRIQAVVVADPSLAEHVYDEAKGADATRFGELARRYSIDEASKANNGDYGVIHAIPEADPALLALGLTLREVGAVGGPVRGRDGRYYVVRMTDAPVQAIPPWGPAMLAKARNLIVRRQRDAALDELAARLRTTTSVRVFDEGLAKLALPSGDKRW
jgi:hypothetical protein